MVKKNLTIFLFQKTNGGVRDGDYDGGGCGGDDCGCGGSDDSVCWNYDGGGDESYGAIPKTEEIPRIGASFSSEYRFLSLSNMKIGWSI